VEFLVLADPEPCTVEFEIGTWNWLQSKHFGVESFASLQIGDEQRDVVQLRDLQRGSPD
jgi:hypothetical protein